MTFKFEWQFKYRDELSVNAGSRRISRSRKSTDLPRANRTPRNSVHLAALSDGNYPRQSAISPARSEPGRNRSTGVRIQAQAAPGSTKGAGRLRSYSDLGRMSFGKWSARSTKGALPGTRASANTSGPDFNRGLDPGEIADLKIRTERRKLVSSAGPIFKRANSPNSDPAV